MFHITNRRQLRPVWLFTAVLCLLTAVRPEAAGQEQRCIAVVDSYVNVRREPSKEAEIVGKLYHNGIGTVLEVENEEWVLIRSGYLRGYVFSGNLMIGEEAEQQISQAGYSVGKVIVPEANVYEEPNENGLLLDIAAESVSLDILEEAGEWTKVVTPYRITGWVLSEQIEKSISYSYGETLKQESERLQQQETANEAAEKEKELWQIAQDELQGNTGTKVAVMDAQIEQGRAREEFLSAGGTAKEAEEIEKSVLESGKEAGKESGAAAKYRKAVEAVRLAMEAVKIDEAIAQEKVEKAQEATITAQAAEKVAIDAARRAPKGAPGYDFSTIRDHTMFIPPSLGEELVNYACQYVGNPYVWGGESLTNGCDCSGFTMLVYARYGISLPHFAQSQAAYGRAVSEEELQPGDLVFFQRGNYIYHVAIYIGNGTIVHAASSRLGICYSAIAFGGAKRLYRRLL